jgi:hypothetical protein
MPLHRLAPRHVNGMTMAGPGAAFDRNALSPGQ